MRGREKQFTFYLSGMEDNDTAVMNYIRSLKGYEDCPYMFFKLHYVPPYQEFDYIKEFQCKSRFKPFVDAARHRKIAVIDLSEWVGHETEEYLEVNFRLGTILSFEISVFSHENISLSADT